MDKGGCEKGKKASKGGCKVGKKKKEPLLSVAKPKKKRKFNVKSEIVIGGDKKSVQAGKTATVILKRKDEKTLKERLMKMAWFPVGLKISQKAPKTLEEEANEIKVLPPSRQGLGQIKLTSFA